MKKSTPKNALKAYFCAIDNLKFKDRPEGCLVPLDEDAIIHAHKYADKIETCIFDIFEECNLQIIGLDLLCQALLVSLTTLIYRLKNTENSPLSQTDLLGTTIKNHIDENYTRSISLNDIANMLYISPDFFSHLFKNHTGYPPINYLINVRINQAKNLLLTTDLTVQEISQKIGYADSNYFTALFKKFTGVSPKRFKGGD